MWPHTVDGFYSAVAHRERPGVLIIRARSLADLERLSWSLRSTSPDGDQWGDATFDGDADYPWRLFLTRGQWARYLERATADLDYDNFKDAVTERLGDERHSTLIRVWSVLQEIEAEPDAAVPDRTPADEEGDWWEAVEQDFRAADEARDDLVDVVAEFNDGYSGRARRLRRLRSSRRERRERWTSSAGFELVD